MGSRYGFLFFIWVNVWAMGCNHNRSSIDNARAENLPAKNTPVAVPAPPDVTYHYQVLTKQDRQKADSLVEHLDVLLALNRVDYKHLLRLDSIIAPDSFYTDFKAYSPFPWQLSFLNEVPKIIFYSYRIQAFAAYENGVLVKWGPVSMGKKSTPTPTGLFFTNWRAKETISTVNDEWIMKWYFNLDNFEGVSMHEYEMPGYPASHACVRLTPADAFWFYNWCEQWVLNKEDKYRSIKAYGTPVLIFGTYDFGGAKPWRNLPVDKGAVTISADELQKETEPHLEIIHKRRQQRDSLMATMVI
ncbi:MAG TPA: L,D-transpeptidase [Chitinophagales bacterium]|nr:L,D-transpeptidase [Chitinophagales bacterium]